MGHYSTEMKEDHSGLSEQEKLSLEIKFRREKEKEVYLVYRNGVRITRGSMGGLVFTSIEIKKT